MDEHRTDRLQDPETGHLPADPPPADPAQGGDTQRLVDDGASALGGQASPTWAAGPTGAAADPAAAADRPAEGDDTGPNVTPGTDRPTTTGSDSGPGSAGGSGGSGSAGGPGGSGSAGGSGSGGGWGGADPGPAVPGGSGTGSYKRLTRQREGRVVAGVAGGLARYLNVDPIILRLAFVGLTLIGFLGLGLYLLAWFMIPEREGVDSLGEALARRIAAAPAWVRVILLVTGTFIALGAVGQGSGLLVVALLVALAVAVLRPRTSGGAGPGPVA